MDECNYVQNFNEKQVVRHVCYAIKKSIEKVFHFIILQSDRTICLIKTMICHNLIKV